MKIKSVLPAFAAAVRALSTCVREYSRTPSQSDLDEMNEIKKAYRYLNDETSSVDIKDVLNTIGRCALSLDIIKRSYGTTGLFYQEALCETAIVAKMATSDLKKLKCAIEDDKILRNITGALNLIDEHVSSLEKKICRPDAKVISDLKDSLAKSRKVVDETIRYLSNKYHSEKVPEPQEPA